MTGQDNIRDVVGSACNNGGYEDIIDMPHHVSPDRSHMSIHDRAAQFAPFAALTGHDEAVRRTQDMVEDMVENEIEKEDIL